MPVTTVPYRERAVAEVFRRGHEPQMVSVPEVSQYSRRSKRGRRPKAQAKPSSKALPEVDTQAQSPLLSLPQELQDQIWKHYYAYHKEAKAVYDGTNGMLIKGGHEQYRSLRLTCRKVNRDTKAIRQAAPWTLTISCNEQGSVDCKQPLAHPKLSKILSKIACVNIVDLTSKRMYTRAHFVSELSTLSTLPSLKVVEVAFSEYFGAYEPGTYYSQPEFTQERKLHEDFTFKEDAMAGVHDNMYSSFIHELAVDHLANILKDAGREYVQVYFLSRKDFRRNRQVWMRDSITFRVLAGEVRVLGRHF